MGSGSPRRTTPGSSLKVGDDGVRVRIERAVGMEGAGHETACAQQAIREPGVCVTGLQRVGRLKEHREGARRAAGEDVEDVVAHDHQFLSGDAHAAGGEEDAAGFRLGLRVVVAGDDDLEVGGREPGEVLQRAQDGRAAVARDDADGQATGAQPRDDVRRGGVGLRPPSRLHLQLREPVARPPPFLLGRKLGDVLEDGLLRRAAHLDADELEIKGARQRQRVVEVEEHAAHPERAPYLIENVVHRPMLVVPAVRPAVLRRAGTLTSVRRESSTSGSLSVDPPAWVSGAPFTGSHDGADPAPVRRRPCGRAEAAGLPVRREQLPLRSGPVRCRSPEATLSCSAPPLDRGHRGSRRGRAPPSRALCRAIVRDPASRSDG